MMLFALVVTGVDSQARQIVPLDMKGCIFHLPKWQIHPFISKGTKCGDYIR